MKNILLLCLVGLVVMACGNEKSTLQSEIAKLEKKLETEATKEVADPLLENYQTFIDKFPEETELNAKFRYRAAGVLYRMNQAEEAIAQPRNALLNYGDAANTYNNAFLLASIYGENRNQKHISNTILQALKEKDLTPEQEEEVNKNLQEALPPIEDRLRVLQSAIFDTETNSIQRRYANEFILSSDYYGILLPEKENMPEILLRAAETARTVQSYPQALELYQRISDRYPDHPKASQALFLRAFTLDNDLKDFTKAKELYEAFLAKYPNDDFADDTQFLLENLGKDDQEIIEAFQKE